MITAENLTRSFGRGHARKTPLDDVSFTFRDGHVTYLLGLNGTGKSTLLRVLAGTLPPHGGQIAVDGNVGMFLSTEAAHRAHTARRHMYWVATATGTPRAEADRMLGRVGLAAVADRPTHAFSLGMKQRLGIATALLGWRRNIILDEPLNGLDVAGILWLRTLLRELAEAGHCVIIASHHMAEVELNADDVLVLEDGRAIASGPLAEVRGDAPTLEAAFVDLVPRANTHKVAP